MINKYPNIKRLLCISDLVEEIDQFDRINHLNNWFGCDTNLCVHKKPLDMSSDAAASQQI